MMWKDGMGVLRPVFYCLVYRLLCLVSVSACGGFVGLVSARVLLLMKDSLVL